MLKLTRIIIIATYSLLVSAVGIQAATTVQNEPDKKLSGGGYEPLQPFKKRPSFHPDADKLVTNPKPGYRQPDQYHVAGEDHQYIQFDDYFVQPQNSGVLARSWVDLARMVNPVSDNTNGEAEFMKVRDGKSYWSRTYWQTRPAVMSELRLGQQVIVFNDQYRNGVYEAPDRKEKARGGSWFMARVTDMTDSYKGYIIVSGSHRVSLKNLRVIVR